MMLSTLFFSACTDNGPEKPGEDESTSLSAEASLSDISGDGEQRSIKITSNAYWTISATEGSMPAKWIVFDTGSGSGDTEVKVTFLKNPSNKTARTATVTVELSDESAKVELPVSQAKATYASGIQPIVNYITYLNKDADKSKPENGILDIENSRFTFNSGAVISTEGAKISEVGWVGTEYYRSILVTNNWGAENAGIFYEIPTTQDLSGTFTMAFGLYPASSSNCFVPKAFKMSWSADKEKWTDVEAVYQWDGNELTAEENAVDDTSSFRVLPNINKASFAHRQAVFTIPDAETIAAGGKLYVRIIPSTKYTIKGDAVNPEHSLRVCYGSVIYQWEKKSYHYNAELGQDGDVILKEGFDDMMSGIDYFAGANHLAYVCGKIFIPKNGWDANNASEAFGYLRFSTGGSHIITPALTAIGTAPADVELKFDLCPYCSPKMELDANVVTVSLEGPGTVGDQPDCETLFITPEDAKSMKTVSVKISGATSETKIKISGTMRWFIDNIVVTK